ncbi:hypothetical protein Emag_003514 [Eimeria magna]
MEAPVAPVAVQHQLLQLRARGEPGGSLKPELRCTSNSSSRSGSSRGRQDYGQGGLWCDCTSRQLCGETLKRIVPLGPAPFPRLSPQLTPWDSNDSMLRFTRASTKEFFLHSAARSAGAAARERELLLLLGSDELLQHFQHAKAPTTTAQLQREQQKDEQAIFILHLEPAAGSPLQRCLSRLRAEAAEAFGVDDTHCYSLHCSVTGFFPCSDIDAFKESLIKLAAELQHQQQQVRGGPPEVIATEDGYVVLPVQCPELVPLVQQLRQQQQQQQLKFKRMDHVTLAAFRQDPMQRQTIADFYNKQFARLGSECMVGPWDLVLYELRRRSAGILIDGTHQLRQLHRCHQLLGSEQQTLQQQQRLQ